jgi:crotonobetainyl-CoA:carnitine CoA-transferase CaiB-like acyl-CoA transferase
MSSTLPLQIASVLILTACSRAPARPAEQTTPAPFQPAPVTAWLDCVECTDAELRAVAVLGDRVVPDLREVLLRGPSKERLDRETQYLEAQYARLKEYEQLHPERRVTRSREDYVAFYRQNYILLNRSRAARALGAIKTSLARTALEEVLTQHLPPELLLEVRRALSQ